MCEQNSLKKKKQVRNLPKLKQHISVEVATDWKHVLSISPYLPLKLRVNQSFFSQLNCCLRIIAIYCKFKCLELFVDFG